MHQNLNLQNFEENLRKHIDEKNFQPSFAYNSQQNTFLNLQQALKSEQKEDLFYCIIDPYNFEDGVNAQVYNFLYLLLQNNLKTVNLISLKDNLLHQNNNPHNFKFSHIFQYDLSKATLSQESEKKTFKYNGESEKTNTKQVNLKSQMDEVSLARDAINLNVKLMKWRMLPNLDFDDLKKTKVLLIGAGTLGC